MPCGRMFGMIAACRRRGKKVNDACDVVAEIDDGTALLLDDSRSAGERRGDVPGRKLWRRGDQVTLDLFPRTERRGSR